MDDSIDCINVEKLFKVLLVNPFASARYLDAKFKEAQIHVTGLYTINLDEIPKYLKPDSNLFDQQIFIESLDVAEIIEKLLEKSFDYVINGFEGCVEIADKLAAYYVPQYANNPETFLLRSNKFEMHQALYGNNIACIKQYIHIAGEILPDIEEFVIDYPCFVKPLAGACSIGANKINSKLEFEQYFSNAKLYNNIWQTDLTRDKFIISEYVYGDEYLVDTFSVEGKHYVSSIQMYYKDRHISRPIYGSFEVVRDIEVINKVTNYIFKVLDATDFKNGFAHSEFFIEPNGTVRLIEINPRISGASGMHNRLARLYGFDQVDLLLKHVFKIDIKSKANDNIYSRVICLFNLSGKPLCNLKQHLAKYQTVFEVVQLVQDGHIKTNDTTLTDAVAFIMLQSSSLSCIEQDTDAIFYQDKLGWSQK